MTSERPYPPYDPEVVSALDSEIKRLVVICREHPHASPVRVSTGRKITQLRKTLDRYISQHSTAGWDGPP